STKKNAKMVTLHKSMNVGIYKIVNIFQNNANSYLVKNKIIEMVDNDTQMRVAHSTLEKFSTETLKGLFHVISSYSIEEHQFQINLLSNVLILYKILFIILDVLKHSLTMQVHHTCWSLLRIVNKHQQ